MILLAETPVKYRDGTVKTLDELGGEVSELLPDTPVKSGSTSKPLDEFIQDQIVLTPETSVVDGEDTTTLEDFVEDSIVLAPDTPVLDGSDTTTLEQFVESKIPQDPNWVLLSTLAATSTTINEQDNFGSFGTAKMLKIIIANSDFDESSMCCHEIILSSNVLMYIKSLDDDADFNLPEVSILNIGKFNLQFIYSETDGYTFKALGTLLSSVSEVDIKLYKGE